MTTQATKLTKGIAYNVARLKHAGWTDGDGSGHEGYNWLDYFSAGEYLGADEHGIEPTVTGDDLAECYSCGCVVQPEDDKHGCGCHCPECNTTL